jgi:hypothetical protein
VNSAVVPDYASTPFRAFENFDIATDLKSNTLLLTGVKNQSAKAQNFSSYGCYGEFGDSVNTLGFV